MLPSCCLQYHASYIHFIFRPSTLKNVKITQTSAYTGRVQITNKKQRSKTYDVFKIICGRIKSIFHSKLCKATIITYLSRVLPIQNLYYISRVETNEIRSEMHFIWSFLSVLILHWNSNGSLLFYWVSVVCFTSNGF